MSGTGDGGVVGASGQGANTAITEQQPAAPRKALKFTTTSKQFVLETENKAKDNKSAVPQLLEQLRPDHAKPTVPNAHTYGIAEPISNDGRDGDADPWSDPSRPSTRSSALSSRSLYASTDPQSAATNAAVPSTSKCAKRNGRSVLADASSDAYAYHGELNVSPHVHNQISPGEEAPQEMKMTQDLAAFVSTLTDADYERLYAAYIEECETKQEHNFREDGSDRHTYSGIADYKSESSDDEEANKGEFTGVGHPHRWDDDPEAEARRQEIKKNFFKVDCKDCECCKGFAMNCPGAICASLGVCHCVYRMQCEETGDDLDKVFISERQSCTCCKGLVYKCACVSEQKKDNCHCIS